MKPLGNFELGKSWTVFQMSFLSEDQMPERMVRRRGSQHSTPYVLLVLTGQVGKRSSLLLRVLTFYPSGDVLESKVAVSLCPFVMLQSRASGFQVPVFTVSHTERVLVLGGHGLLQFYAIYEEEIRGKAALKLALIEDTTRSTDEIRSAVTSCVALPYENKLSGAVCDFLVVGDAAGKLYGFKFDLKEGSNRSELLKSGILRTNTHADEGVAISALISRYGDGPESLFRAIQDQGVSFSNFLLLYGLQGDSRSFFSVGGNGRLLLWKSDEEGWKSSELTYLPSATANDFGAAHSSRLVPHVVMLVNTEREEVILVDSTAPHSIPPHGRCSYV